MSSYDDLLDAESANQRRRATDHWHVGKEIPIALIAVVLIQTGGGVWWASAMNAKIDTLSTTLQEFRAERYTKEDGRRDREFLMLTLESLKSRDIELDRRLSNIERTHELIGATQLKAK